MVVTRNNSTARYICMLSFILLFSEVYARFLSGKTEAFQSETISCSVGLWEGNILTERTYQDKKTKKLTIFCVCVCVVTRFGQNKKISDEKSFL